MADTLQFPNETPEHHELDAVELHSQASNSLSRCQLELNSPHTSYELVAKQLRSALERISALSVMQAHNLIERA